MRTKDAKNILNCSSMTITNYIRSGRLKLNKILPNGRYDINEESIYSVLSESQTKSKPVNFLLAIDQYGNKHEYFLDEVTMNQILDYISEKQRHKLP